MPHLPALPTPPARSVPNGRVCPSCNAPMRLGTVESHPRYLNIDVQNYSCDCGHKEDLLVAHKD